MKVFPSIRIEGGLLGPDVLDQLISGELPGQHPTDFGLDGRRNLTDEIASAFADARTLWSVFRHRLERLPESDPGTSLTRDGWVIPFLTLLGYELRYNPKAYEVDGLTFAISHRAGEDEDAPPVHIVSARQDLGRLAPTGRPRLAPHSLVQEFLNRTEHLWGIVTNGRTLRLLRDCTYIRRQAYVEFDLAAILEEQHFEDFVLLYRLLHRTRLPKTAAEAHQCLLEQYYQHSVEQGGRVRDRLRDGVEECIKRLANGFLSHPANAELRQRIAGGEQGVSGQRVSDESVGTAYAQASPYVPSSLTPEEFYRQLLRLVYRFLFLLVSEDRGLISSDPLYQEHYGVARFRRLVDKRSAYNDYEDLWHSLRVLWKVLSDEKFAELLGVAPLNGELFARIDLDNCSLSNRDLLEALRHLIYYEDNGSLRRVNYAALDTEELGSVYESLLEYHPVVHAGGGRTATGGLVFDLVFGSERKSTGSYYTPPELVAELVKSALEPVIEERLAEAKRMANSEWRVAPKEIQRRFIHEVFPRLSRPGSLAKSPAGGQESLSSDRGVSAGGAIWPDQPNAPGSDLGSSEYRGGLGTALHGGIHSVSPSGERQPDRVGDASYPEYCNQSGFPGSGTADSGGTSGNWQAAQQPGTQPPTEKELTIAWRSTPFAIRHSLFAEHALLSVRVLDPACGSGHFLLAAARRLGKELAKVRTGEDEPAPERVREAIRDVVSHCIYGVDKNPLAVELCRVALWLEAHCEGKPLTFLDHRIRCGDSLVGVFDLNVLQQGIPDEAFEPVSTDAKEAAGILKRRNRNERLNLERGQLRIPFPTERLLGNLGQMQHQIGTIADDSPDTVHRKKDLYEQFLGDPEREKLAKACNLWTAAFFQQFTHEMAKSPKVITTDVVTDHLAGRVHPQAVAAAEDLAVRHRFFHWPLEFPEVFEKGGFDVVLSNPPWERIKLQEEEFFATRNRDIANASNAAARKRLIRELPRTNPALWEEYHRALRGAESASRFLRGSGRYPLAGRGDVNTYAVFAELARQLLGPTGRAGIIAPTGIATDATTQLFFRDLVERQQLVSLYDFENRKKLFPAVDSRMKFCLLTMTGAARPAAAAEFAFFCQEASDLSDAERRFTLSSEDFRLLNPNTGTAPIFRSRRDAELTRHIYKRVPVLINERIANREWRRMDGETEQPFAIPHSPFADANPWGVEFLAMFHMANDSHLFRTREQLEAEGYRLEGNVFVGADLRVRPENQNNPCVRPDNQNNPRVRPENQNNPRVHPDNQNDQRIRPDNPRIRPDGQSSRLDDQCVHPDNQNSRLDNQHVRPNDQNSRLDDQRARPNDQNSRFDNQRVCPNNQHVRPDDSGTHAGEGTYVGADTHIGVGTHVGEGTRIGVGTHVGEDTHVGEGTHVGVGTHIGVPLLLPLYEAKMIHQFDHRFGDYRDQPPDSKDTRLPEVPLERLVDPNYQVLPRYWVPAEEVEARLAAKGWDRGWLLGWRDIARSTDERTVIAAVIPRVGAGHKYLLMLPAQPQSAAPLLASLNSLVFDYCARQKLSGFSLTYFTMKQLPVLPPAVFDRPCPWISYHSPIMGQTQEVAAGLMGQTQEVAAGLTGQPHRVAPTIADWMRPRVLELTYTAWDLAPFARDLGYDGPPFRYDPERRFHLRCELDAAFFILYLGTPDEWEREATPELKDLFPTPRDAVAYILDQFPIVRRKDEERYGCYRTKDTILEIYDKMLQAMAQNAP